MKQHWHTDWQTQQHTCYGMALSCSVNYCLHGNEVSWLYGWNMLLPALFQLAVTFFLLLLACIDSLSLPPAPWVVCESCPRPVCIHACERKIFGLLVAWVVQKVYGKTGPLSDILCSFFFLHIDCTDRSWRNKLWQNFAQGCRLCCVRQCWQKPLACCLILPDANQKWLRYHCTKTSETLAWIGHDLGELSIGKGRK